MVYRTLHEVLGERDSLQAIVDTWAKTRWLGSPKDESRKIFLEGLSQPIKSRTISLSCLKKNKKKKTKPVPSAREILVSFDIPEG